MFASGEFAVPTVRWLASSGHEIAALVSQPSRPSGRGRVAAPTPAAACAAALGITVAESEDVNASDFVDRIRALDAQLGIVIAFGQKLGGGLLAAARCGCVNLHGSLLPKYRGAAPIAWAILCGEDATGVSVFRLAGRMDAGAILVTRETAIGRDETAGELHDRLALLGPEAIAEAVAMFEGEADPAGQAQDDRRASIAPKLTKQAGRIDFRRASVSLARHIRAMTPWPGARCLFCSADGRHREEVALCRARACEGQPDRVPRGEVGQVLDTGEVLTGDGTLEILSVQPTGKRVMAWQDFVNGRHVRPGDRFASLPSNNS